MHLETPFNPKLLHLQQPHKILSGYSDSYPSFLLTLYDVLKISCIQLKLSKRSPTANLLTLRKAKCLDKFPSLHAYQLYLDI